MISAEDPLAGAFPAGVGSRHLCGLRPSSQPSFRPSISKLINLIHRLSELISKSSLIWICAARRTHTLLWEMIERRWRASGSGKQGIVRDPLDGHSVSRLMLVNAGRDALRGRPYHISALYVVDLERFRQLAAGDRLRGQYQALSADPNSLANLDQDLPNNMQNMLPIVSQISTVMLLACAECRRSTRLINHGCGARRKRQPDFHEKRTCS